MKKRILSLLLAMALTFGSQVTVMAAEITETETEIQLANPEPATMKGWLNPRTNGASLTYRVQPQSKLWMTVGVPSSVNGDTAIADAKVTVYRDGTKIWSKVIPADDSVTRYLIDPSCTTGEYKVVAQTNSDECKSYIVLTVQATQYI